MKAGKGKYQIPGGDELGSARLETDVFTKGTKKNLNLKKINAFPSVSKVAKQDLNLNDDNVHGKDIKFTPGTAKVNKREIECGEQAPASRSDRPVPSKDDIRKPLYKDTFSPGTKRVHDAIVKSGDHAKISKKGADIFSDTADIHDHNEVVDKDIVQDRF